MDSSAKAGDAYRTRGLGRQLPDECTRRRREALAGYTEGVVLGGLAKGCRLGADAGSDTVRTGRLEGSEMVMRTPRWAEVGALRDPVTGQATMSTTLEMGWSAPPRQGLG